MVDILFFNYVWKCKVWGGYGLFVCGDGCVGGLYLSVSWYNGLMYWKMGWIDFDLVCVYGFFGLLYCVVFCIVFVEWDG